MTYVKTIVLSDNVLLREGIAQLLEGSRFQVSRRISSVDLLRTDFQQDNVDLFVVVIDESSCALVGNIRRQYSDAKVVVLALRDSQELMCQAAQFGAMGYLIETVSAQNFIMSLEVVIANGAVYPQELLARLSEIPREERILQDGLHRSDGTSFSGFSGREVGILEGLVQGESNKAIARQLQIAEATVKVHVKAILRKLRVKNRTQAAMWAVQNSVASHGHAAVHDHAPEMLIANAPIRSMVGTRPSAAMFS